MTSGLHLLHSGGIRTLDRFPRCRFSRLEAERHNDQALQEIGYPAGGEVTTVVTLSLLRFARARAGILGSDGNFLEQLVSGFAGGGINKIEISGYGKD
jgi:hypothetical protein